MATARGSIEPKKKKVEKQQSELKSPKNIAIAVAVVILVGGMGVRLMYYYGVLGAEKPDTSPAVVDPTSNYDEKEKQQLQKIEEQQKIEEAKPNRPPPSGS